MSLFKDTVASIEKNKKRLEEGKYNCIPFSFDRLRQKIPGIVQGTNWIVTANSGVGKSQLTKYLFVLEPLQWIREHPESGLSIKVLYFALEETKKEFMYSMICNRLKREHNILIDPLELASMYENNSLDDATLELIKKEEAYFESFLEDVEIIDSISNPYGIYKYIRRYSKENGTHYYYNFKTDKAKNNPVPESVHAAMTEGERREYAYSHYVPDNPDEYVICIVDHFSLLQPEKGAGLHETMTKMSADYGRKQITKHYNYVFVNVQQQAAGGEEKLFNNAGEKIIEKLKPSLGELGDNKLTQRDAHVVLGLFAPVRYGIKKYSGYNIERLDDQYRSLIVLKNRIGRGNLESPLYFNGASNHFTEFPLPDQMTEKWYESVEDIQKQMR